MTEWITHATVHRRKIHAAGGPPIPVVNPATEEAWCGVASADADAVEKAVAGERSEHSSRRGGTCRRANAPKRLFAIARVIRQNAEELAQLDVRVGKPVADARGEVAAGARVFEYYAGAVGKFFGQTIPVARGGFDFTIRQPVGVVTAIVPWNFPFPITSWKVAPALAAGNCVIVKPAELSPLSALRLAALGAQAGLPAGCCRSCRGRDRRSARCS